MEGGLNKSVCRKVYIKNLATKDLLLSLNGPVFSNRAQPVTITALRLHSAPDGGVRLCSVLPSCRPGSCFLHILLGIVFVLSFFRPAPTSSDLGSEVCTTIPGLNGARTELRAFFILDKHSAELHP